MNGGLSVPTAPLARRGRGPDRARLVAVGLVGFLAVALVKPWDLGAVGGVEQPAGDRAEGSAARPDSAAVAGERPAAGDLGLGAPRSAAPIRLGIPGFDRAALQALPQPPATWGIRAVIARPDRRPGDRPPTDDEWPLDGWLLSGRWAPAVPASPGLLSYSSDPARIVSDAVLMPTDGLAVAAVGVTSPPADTPLDVRIWRLPAGRTPERLVVRDVIGPEPTGQRLFLPPVVSTAATGSGSTDHWLPGLYRIDLLMGTYISRLTMLLPGYVGDEPTSGSPANLGPASGRSVSTLPLGPFLVDAERGALHVAALPGRALSERESWFLAGAEPRVGEASSIVRVASDQVLGFGLRWPESRPLRSALLYRLAPDGEGDPVAQLQGWRRIGTPRPRARIAWAMFQSGPQTMTWAPGVYRMDAEWSEDGRIERGSWHIDLVPAHAPLTTPPFLAATRDWKQAAGRPSIAVGTAQHWQGGPRHAQVRVFAQRPGSVPLETEALGTRCQGAALLDPGQRLVGIGQNHAQVVPTVRVVRLFRFRESTELPAGVAAGAAPGLVVIGSPDGRSWPPGYYSVELSYPEPVYDPDPVERFVFCVGQQTAEGLRVPVWAAIR